MPWIFLEEMESKSEIVTFFLAFLMVSQGVTVLADSDRIYPTKKVTLYRGDKIVGVYTKEAPLPEGSFISADGRCAIKLDDLYLVGEDQSVFLNKYIRPAEESVRQARHRLF